MVKKDKAELNKLLVRMPPEMYNELREITYATRVPMAKLCREGLEYYVLPKYRKKLKK